MSELKTETEGKFVAVDERFERVDQALEDPHQQVKSGAETLGQRMSSEFEGIRRDLSEMVTERIKSEGEATRRHFDVVAEMMVSSAAPTHPPVIRAIRVS